METPVYNAPQVLPARTASAIISPLMEPALLVPLAAWIAFHRASAPAASVSITLKIIFVLGVPISAVPVQTAANARPA